MNKVNEYILCAAIHFEDNLTHEHQPKNVLTGFVLCGHRHHNVFTSLAIMGVNRLKYYDSTQGFLTNTNRFVDRKEGMRIAKKANQLTDRLEHKTDSLYSEHLY
jgi:hypothetical protein